MGAGVIAVAGKNAHVSWIYWLLLALFITVVFVVGIIRMDKRGPAMRWIPRSMRPRANAWYRKNGWPEPFDENGDRKPGRW